MPSSPHADRSRIVLGAGFLALGFVVPLALPGCVDANNRLQVGAAPDQVKFEALEGAQPLAEEPAAGEAAFLRPDDPPSVVSLDRANWEPRSLDQPVDYTLHRPHYRAVTTYPNRLPRERGEFPTAITALDLSCESDDQQAWHALTAPFGAMLEGLAIPFRLIVEPQTTVWRSPDQAYQRVPATIPPPPVVEPGKPPVSPGTPQAPSAPAPAPAPASAEPGPQPASSPQ